MTEKEYYIPKILRPNEWGIGKRREAWGIGPKDGEAMTAGPFDSEAQALEWLGERGERIYYFPCEGGQQMIWAWRKDRWIKI